MIETTLKLNAEDYIGRPDLVLCNGATVSFFYFDFSWYDREAGCMDYDLCAEVVLYEYMPPRRASLDKSPKLDDLPF